MEDVLYTLVGEYLAGYPTAAHEIIERAKRDPAEMQRLVDLFYSCKSNKSDDFMDRIRLAELLIYLKYPPVKKFLIDIIEGKDAQAEAMQYGYGWSKVHDKIWAAGRLIYMGDLKGKYFLEKIIDNLDQDQIKQLALELYEEADPVRCSMATLECLLEFADKYKKIANKIDRKKIEVMIKRLQDGEIFTWEVPWWDIV
jgi:hypothetical protein